MSEEIKKAYKLFNREDLIDDGYERDLNSNIQVFLTTKQMINYMNLQQKVEQLEKENKELKQPQVFIDCENMEERYGRNLYEDYLKEKIEQLENIKKEAIEYIKENSKSYSLPNTIKDMRYIDFYKLLDILNK